MYWSVDIENNGNPRKVYYIYERLRKEEGERGKKINRNTFVCKFVRHFASKTKMFHSCGDVIITV